MEERQGLPGWPCAQQAAANVDMAAAPAQQDQQLSLPGTSTHSSVSRWSARPSVGAR
jgi:hypothetical protein